MSFVMAPTIPQSDAMQEATRPAGEQRTTSTLPQMSVVLGIPAAKADRDFAYTLSFPNKEIAPREVEKGWRIDELDIRNELQIIPASPDGKPPILTDGGEWNVILRSSNGEAFQDPMFIGMADRLHAYLFGTSSAKQILLVSRMGEIRVLADAPEHAMSLGVKDGSVWLATYTPGEGIESDLKGPSRLIRISPSGLQEVIAQEANVIVRVIPGPEKSLAYHTEEGNFVSIKDEKRWSGNGLPLLWLDATKLLFAQEKKIYVLDMETLEQEFYLDAPASPMVAHVL